MDGEGFPPCGFHLHTIWVVLSNQNVLSVIKTICLLCAFLLEKPVVFGTLGVAQGHSNLKSPFHPRSRKPRGGIEMPSSCLPAFPGRDGDGGGGVEDKGGLFHQTAEIILGFDEMNHFLGKLELF